MIDFPNSPTTGQIYNSGTGPIYIWDGVAWSLVTQATRTARQNNLVVNPAMAVSQENGTTAVAATAAYPVDQWNHNFTGPVCSSQQITTYSPDTNIWRIRKTVTTPKASLAAGDYSVLQQPIEGSRLTALGYGYGSAIQAVLRFGWKAPAGTYSFRLSNDLGTRSYVKNFTITAAQANTDTVQVFAIPGETSGVWKFDNTLAAYLTICDAVGTTNQGVEGWNNGSFLGTAANSNMVATNGNVVELFDVGLYPDPEKTGLPPPFIAPMYDAALRDCLRYWGNQYIHGIGYNVTGGAIGNYIAYKAMMRVPPTLAFTAVTYSNCSGMTAGTPDASGVAWWSVVSASGSAGSNANVKLNARM